MNTLQQKFPRGCPVTKVYPPAPVGILRATFERNALSYQDFGWAPCSPPLQQLLKIPAMIKNRRRAKNRHHFVHLALLKLIGGGFFMAVSSFFNGVAFPLPLLMAFSVHFPIFPNFHTWSIIQYLIFHLFLLSDLNDPTWSFSIVYALPSPIFLALTASLLASFLSHFSATGPWHYPSLNSEFCFCWASVRS